ncbi:MULTISPECIES: hypothetical protein [unclassified Phaeobacter]|uniref:hypothetical protein n=1 Tax=unclassified Phaeobacter TaxID=2621772 RepID=UPI003A847B12
MSEPEQLIIPGFERVLSDAAEFRTFTQGLRNESPRAIVLITMCVMDALLDKLVRLCLDTSEMNSAQKDALKTALKNFTSNVALAQGLGLLGNIEAKSLVVLNSVRNKFAHSWDASFNSMNVVKECEKLHLEFSDEQDEDCAKLAYDKFRYSIGSLLRDIIARCSLLQETGEVSAFSSKRSFNRKFTGAW